ncbi:hypothetical protein IM774_03595 [Erysipelotrichaceae bacterium RD49]|nr:hypothetical protein [Erysipelotrichaceae bacterium RD49]
MPADQILSLAQLCIKTGRYAKGDALLPSIQKEQARCVLVSDGCGANRAKKIQDKCAFYHIALIKLPAWQFDAISSKVNGAVAILDPGFASGIIKAALRKQNDPEIELFNLPELTNPKTSQ